MLDNLNQQSSYLIESKNNLKYVEVLIEFVKFGEIDTMNEKFSAELNIESKWIENLPMMPEIEYDANKYWNPKLYIENALNINDEKINYEIEKDADGFIWIIEKRNVKGVFWERLELQNFPFDIQELSITLSSKLTKKEIKLISCPNMSSHVNINALKTFKDQQKWVLYKMVKISEFSSYDLEGSLCSNQAYKSSNRDLNDQIKIEIPKLVATSFVSRRSGYYIINGFFLIFLITFSSITIFSVDCKLPQNRLQTSYTLLLTIVSFKWIINKFLPSVSYLTSLDKYAIVSIFYVCMLCLWHSIVGAFWARDFAFKLDKIALTCFTLIFLFIHFYMGITFYRAHRKIVELSKRNMESLNSTSSSTINYQNGYINGYKIRI